MFSSKCNYPKLKTNLRLTVNRLKLLEKKKTELALKSRKEIADYIQAGKEDRARIRVEHIVREDYMVEGLEILEMFCDLLLARFGIIERVSAMDPTIEEAVASVIWAEPRLSADIPELMVISKNLMARYGKEYHAACKSNSLNTVNDKLMRKMSIYSPPKMLIENYMVEISKSFNVEFQPDPLLLLGEDGGMPLDDLIGLGGDFKYPGGPPPPTQPPGGGSSGGGGHGGGGGGGMAYPPAGANTGYPPAAAQGGYPPAGPQAGYTPQGGYPPAGPQAGYPPAGPQGGYPPTSPQTGYPPAGAQANAGYPPAAAQPPPVPSMPPVGPAGGPPSGHTGFNIPPDSMAPGPNLPSYNEKPGVEHPPNYSSLNIRNNLSDEPGGGAGPAGDIPSLPEIPGDGLNLPSVPGSVNTGPPPSQPGPDSSNPNDIDFDDLAARFEKLKKKK